MTPAIRLLEQACRALDQMSKPIPNVVNQLGADQNKAEAAMLRRAVDVLKDGEEPMQHLRFVERWVNHHGQHSRITPQEVLSMIQHYPPIKDITKSYVDGKLPPEPDPWAAQIQTEKALRRLLCVRSAEVLPYMDDGEAQCSAMEPAIDFMRDTPDQINRKLIDRGLTKLGAAVEQRDSLLQLALDAVQANHKWHQDYDDIGEYPGSELESSNLAAIKSLQGALAFGVSKEATR